MGPYKWSSALIKCASLINCGSILPSEFTSVTEFQRKSPHDRKHMQQARGGKKKMYVSTRINHFIMSEPRERNLRMRLCGQFLNLQDEYLWSAKCSGEYYIFTLFILHIFTNIDEPCALSALPCISPFNLSSSVLIWDVSPALISSRLHVRVKRS